MKNLYPAKAAIRSLIVIALLCMNTIANAYQKMTTNFYIIPATGAPVLMDGNMTIYDNQYSNGVDWHDGTKMNNSGENWGLIREGVSLVVERRQLVTVADTAFLNMWGMQQRNYRFEVKLTYFDETVLTACVWDAYLRKITPVSFTQTTNVDFTVDANPASKAAGRFRIYYMTPLAYTVFVNSVNLVLPVTFTGVNASRNKEDIQVSWAVENEINIDNYSVEVSADGRSFKSLDYVAPLNTTVSHSYSYKEINAGKAVRYYRIKSISIGGKTGYSNIAKVAAVSEQASLNIYPNPVTNKKAQLQWNNLVASEYKASLIYPNGKMQQLNSIRVPAGQSTSTLQLPYEATPGTYQLRLINGSNTVIVKTIVLL
ncbi:T9SS type A sorting domain-containing protein [Ferruginibacter sp. HRS2-29]|uniref:T9SS type A sorting domain-containing protein n=1 Tax=Ferruginibacter sp. HRS2-29 TaxID=2487334 RepID=UPI0020CC57A7|nr:T9SS type A sorting domain-containing protein [Ferruginibacter sp. HRS2-29]MCP9751986.1 T9SS C-terminal target domain-containing protein [Ferruginibacter sp. HRS2-29]